MKTQAIQIPYSNDSPLTITAITNNDGSITFHFVVGSPELYGHDPKEVLFAIAQDIFKKLRV